MASASSAHWGGINSEANAINNLGQVVGESQTSSDEGHAFIWDKTTGIRDLGPHCAWTINDAGQVIVLGYWRHLLVEAGRGDVAVAAIPPLNSSGFYGINNNGYVFSVALHPGKGCSYTFIWRQDRGTEWLFPLRDQVIEAGALNDANQVAICEAVFYSGWLKRLIKRNLRPHRQSFLWTRQRGRVFLDKYVRDQSSDYFSISDLANNGCIVGTVHRESGSISRAVLLEPIPERWAK